MCLCLISTQNKLLKISLFFHFIFIFHANSSITNNEKVWKYRTNTNFYTVSYKMMYNCYYHSVRNYSHFPYQMLTTCVICSNTSLEIIYLKIFQIQYGEFHKYYTRLNKHPIANLFKWIHKFQRRWVVNFIEYCKQWTIFLY